MSSSASLFFFPCKESRETPVLFVFMNYSYIYVYMHICMYVCIYICLYVCIYLYIEGPRLERLSCKDQAGAKVANECSARWPSQDILLFQGLCSRINTYLCEHHLCLALPSSIAHTIAQYLFPSTILNCNIHHTILLMAISFKGQSAR